MKGYYQAKLWYLSIRRGNSLVTMLEHIKPIKIEKILEFEAL